MLCAALQQVATAALRAHVLKCLREGEVVQHEQHAADQLCQTGDAPHQND
jgi:hypothetical protein